MLEELKEVSKPREPVPTSNAGSLSKRRDVTMRNSLGVGSSRFSAIRSSGGLIIERLARPYSFRRAITGSTRDARRAGTKQARAATPRRMRETTVIVGM